MRVDFYCCNGSAGILIGDRQCLAAGGGAAIQDLLEPGADERGD
jgi:hypothetical protein